MESRALLSFCKINLWYIFIYKEYYLDIYNILHNTQETVELPKDRNYVNCPCEYCILVNSIVLLLSRCFDRLPTFCKYLPSVRHSQLSYLAIK